MFLVSLGKKQWDSTWYGLPGEIRLLILERYNFGRIKLTPSRLVAFSSMVHRNRALVRYIWFCLELDDYDCTKCAPCQGMVTDVEWEEAFAIIDTNNCPVTTAFQNLFSILSTWDPNGDLTFDISIYSPNILGGGGMMQTILDKVHNDPQHGWVAGFRHSAPPRAAILKVFHSVMGEGPFDSEQSELQWWDRLPLVPAVTSLLLRQQNRRRWKPGSFAHMFARFPRLQEVHYEPWREWDSMQRVIQIEVNFQYLFESIQHFNNNLKRLVVFENFNQQYSAIMQRFLLGVNLSGCDSARNPAPAISRMIALVSLKLEHLATSLIVDASHFFEMEPSWEWPNLTSPVIISKLLMADETSIEIGAMLRVAAAAAIKMPRLGTIEIWNGRKGLTTLFKYQAFRDIQQALITWRAVVHQYDGWRLNLVQERLDEAAIKSHGDAIHYLGLSSQVIRPISLQQIRIEQKALEGVETV
ncbi:hypothetical protein F5B21DRAFT_515270 [Xylaria acuta]|nr:hypothetical protein F5B21DRAFT_515270 [Xylaria acuta]